MTVLSRERSVDHKFAVTKWLERTREGVAGGRILPEHENRSNKKRRSLNRRKSRNFKKRPGATERKVRPERFAEPGTRIPDPGKAKRSIQRPLELRRKIRGRRMGCGSGWGRMAGGNPWFAVGGTALEGRIYAYPRRGIPEVAPGCNDSFKIPGDDFIAIPGRVQSRLVASRSTSWKGCRSSRPKAS